MYKEKEKTVKVCNWSTSSVSLNNILKKVFLGIRSVCIYIKEKLMYGVNIQITPVNSIRGKFKVELQRRSKLQIGEFLMTAGPCYIKCTEGAKCIIGNNVFLNHNSSITCAKEINIGDNCNIANNAVIVDHDHKLGEYGVEEGLESNTVYIGKNVWIGANVVVLKGVKIGDGAVIAAGAVVNHDIPSYQVWGGIPAHYIRDLK